MNQNRDEICKNYDPVQHCKSFIKLVAVDDAAITGDIVVNTWVLISRFTMAIGFVRFCQVSRQCSHVEVHASVNWYVSLLVQVTAWRLFGIKLSPKPLPT